MLLETEHTNVLKILPEDIQIYFLYRIQTCKSTFFSKQNTKDMI